MFEALGFFSSLFSPLPTFRTAAENRETDPATKTSDNLANPVAQALPTWSSSDAEDRLVLLGGQSREKRRWSGREKVGGQRHHKSASLGPAPLRILKM